MHLFYFHHEDDCASCDYFGNDDLCGKNKKKKHGFITILMSDETELQCEILDYHDYDDKQYMILKHPNGIMKLFYEMIRSGNGEVTVSEIKNKDELNKVRSSYYQKF
jgi:hypothetical protein